MISKNLLYIILFTLAGCSNDISIKSDLGENIIIKESAIYPSIFPKDKLLVRANSLIKFWEKRKQECVQRPIGGKLSSIEKICSRFDEAIASAYQERSFIRDVIMPAPDIFEVRFRLIFNGLNNKKTSGKYQKVICISPRLKRQDREIARDILPADSIELNRDSSNKSFLPSTTSFAIKNKICANYARF